MTDANRGQKKRLTIVATPEGIEKAENALIRLGFDNKSNFAESHRLARNSVTKFFSGQPIQLDTFKKICQELTLDWKAIVGITEPESSSPIERYQEASLEVGRELATSQRKVTVIDAKTEQVKAVVVLEGDSLSNLRILEAILREYSGYSINIVDIQQGSIRLIIKGLPEEIDRLLFGFEAGDLTELNGLPVENLQILNDRDDDDRERPDNKWDLVKEIVTHPKINRRLNSVDLSDADLSQSNLIRADLSGADLSGADLSGADLSGANLRGADLRGADLRGADLRGANLIRADLRGANLIRADLRGADLIGTNLRGANLRGANLRGANLIGIEVYQIRTENPSGANPSEANLIRADLSEADLRETDLIRANLIRADLSEANLSGATVFQTRFVDSIGISDSLKCDFIARGAIFDDSLNDRSPVLV